MLSVAYIQTTPTSEAVSSESLHKIAVHTILHIFAGAIGSLVLAPGLYNWAGGVNVANDVTLFGGATDSA